MRVLIFGGNGMLGHKVYQACHERFDTWVAMRQDCRRYGLFDLSHIAEYYSAGIIGGIKPDVVVNCAGVVKQRSSAGDVFRINSIFPHQLAVCCAPRDIRLIHISTDCVFSGRRGQYTEDDIPDPVDQYGWSKLLGEVTAPGCLTLRTSFIGRRLRGSYGLLEWLIGERGRQVQGYTQALFSGMTTIALARIIAGIVETKSQMHGMYHVGAPAIIKYRLLKLLNEAYSLNITVLPDSSSPVLQCDRSLEVARFYTATGFSMPTWPTMVEDLKNDPTPYDDWRAL